MRKRVIGEKKRFPFTFFGIAVLAVLLILALNTGGSKEFVLFDKNAPVTLYAKTAEGIKPQIHAEDYFPEAELEAELFTFDWEKCNLDMPGTYLIPVFYGGKATVCLLALEVQAAEPKKTSGEPQPGADGSEIYSAPPSGEAEMP